MVNSVQFVTDDSGQKTAVVLPIAEYERLMEDLEDYAIIADRRKEPTISHELFVSELKQDGTLPSWVAQIHKEGSSANTTARGCKNCSSCWRIDW